MAHLFPIGVFEGALVSGSGAYTLTGAAAGHRTFASKLAVGDTCVYRAQVLGGAWEIGTGTLTSATTLSRTLIESSTGSLIAWPANTVVELFAVDPPGSYVRRDGDTMTGSLTATGLKSHRDGAHVFTQVSGQPGWVKGFEFQSNGSTRWQHASDNTSETGSNAGSNYYLARHDDSGNQIEVVQTISRATGVVNFAKNPTVGSNSLWHAGNLTSPDGRYLRLSGGTLTGALTLSGNGTATNHAVTKGQLDAVSTVANAALPRAGGTMSGHITLVGDGTATNHPATFAQAFAAHTAANNARAVADAALPKTGGTLTGGLQILGGGLNVQREGGLNGEGIISFGNSGSKYMHYQPTPNTISFAGMHLASGGNIVANGNVTATGNAVAQQFQSSTPGVYAVHSSGSQYNSGGDNYITYGLAMVAAGLGSNLYLVHRVNVAAYTALIVGSAAYTFDSGGNAVASTAWLNGSDGGVKTHREVIASPLDKVGSLTGYAYSRTDWDGRRDVGLLAQDVREVLPEAVHVGDKAPHCDPEGEGFLSVNYNSVVALLVEAVKELRAEVAALKAERTTP